MRSFSIEKLFFLGILMIILIICMNLNLESEIIYEPMYTEINMPIDDNLSFKGCIKNIGSEDVAVNCTVEGIKHISFVLSPPELTVMKGNGEFVTISVNTSGSIPGCYNGSLLIWNKDTKEVLEKIPITIQVKNSGYLRMAPQDQKLLHNA